jgi:hypothetical protein
MEASMNGSRREYWYYIACRPTRELMRLYPQRSSDGVQKYLTDALAHTDFAASFRVEGRPSMDLFPPERKGEAATSRQPTDLDRAERPLIVSLAIRGEDALAAVSSAIKEKTALFMGGAADIPISAAEHWCPREALDPLFGDRRAALELIGAVNGDLGGLTGKNVNVAIVDQGIDAAQLEQTRPGSFGGGWPVGTVQPGTIASRHGMMMARNILAIAPDAKLFDLPLVPERIGDVHTYLSTAEDAFQRARSGIAYTGHWVFVNAWSVYDRRLDSPIDPYCTGGAHRFSQLIGEIVGSDRHDVVFCAGNCGQFCPDARCGPTTLGPGYSILGANSHAKVLTVGAVRTDGLWLGYSSQGPGQAGLSQNKPDLCAPSQFRDGNDAGRMNTGTSAAAAIAAGVIAALRERWDANAVPPETLIDVLRESAHSSRPGWEDRLGCGILSGSAAREKLASRSSSVASVTPRPASSRHK